MYLNPKNKDDKYIMEGTAEQFAAIATACDFFMRVDIGQFNEIFEMWKNKHESDIPLKNKDTLTESDIDLAEELLNAAKLILTGMPKNASYGVGQCQSQRSKLAHEVDKVIRYELWKNDEGRSSISVDSCKPCLNFSGEEFVVMKKKEDKNGKDTNIPKVSV